MSARARMALFPRVVAVVVVLVALAATVQPAFAQPPKDKLPIFAADAQGALPKLPTDPVIAQLRGLPDSSLAAWGPGFNIGAYVYPLRGKKVSVGVGAAYQWVRGTYTPDMPANASPGYDPGPSVTTKFVSFSPTVTLNFGHRRGWSYLSGGMGPSTLTVSRDDLDPEEGEPQNTLSWGGGGKWFAKPRFGFSFDVRIYNIPVQEPSDLQAGHPSGQMLVLNIGVSFQ